MRATDVNLYRNNLLDQATMNLIVYSAGGGSIRHEALELNRRKKQSRRLLASISLTRLSPSYSYTAENAMPKAPRSHLP